MLKQILLSPIDETESIDEIESVKKQVYIPISYNDPHDHLPVLWRVLTGLGSSENGPIGHAFLPPFHSTYPYGYVYLDRIFNYKKYAKELGDSPRKLSRWAGRQIWKTYIHEFFHLYFQARFELEDTYEYKFNKQTKKMVRGNYPFTYARQWESNERIVDGLATAFTKIIFEEPVYSELIESWYSCFLDFDQPFLKEQLK